ncbi:nitroreductase [Microbacterium sp. NPDC058062]|uniref:nitroreductase n=1 Tax=Microbacterium sp. NPDC058062 TaxID=3346320 RepID=UPI0036DB3B41
MDRRFSCRGFTDQPVAPETIRRILETAQRSPSWSNVQPWRAVVLGGPELANLRERLLAAAVSFDGVSDVPPPEQYIGPFRDRRRASGFALYDSLGITRDDVEGRTRQMRENFRFFGAPHVAIVTSDASLGPYGYVDTGAFIAYFLLAATSHGVASIAQAAIAMQAEVVREVLGIPESQHIICGISFGYEDADHPANAFRTDRAPFDEAFDLRGIERIEEAR